jgi:hypothetical protein
MSERLARFPGTSWVEITGLSDPARRTIQHAILGLLADPVPAQAAPFPPDDPLPGAYELRVPADNAIIWYALTECGGHEIINVLLTSGQDPDGTGG